MNRRKFIKQSVAASALTAVGGLTLQSFNSKTQKRITILHTNDTHSHIEPFEASHYRYANKGGVSRRAALVEAVRKKIRTPYY